MCFLLGNKSKRVAAAEETEYDNYAAAEQKSVTEEQVLRKLEDSYQASKTPDPAPTVDDNDDDAMSYFAKLADS